MSALKNLLLIYQGYPRLSQTYQIDEATILSNYFNVLIVSLSWPVYTECTENILPYKFAHKIEDVEKDIDQFKPHIIHGHFLNNSSMYLKLAKKHKVKFSIRTHSFDILTSDSNLLQSKDDINSEWCSCIITFPPFKEKLTKLGFNPNKIITSFPSIYIERYFDTSPQKSNNIISGGAFLPKKNIKGFIDLAYRIKKEIKENVNIKYYSVPEERTFYNSIIKYNESLGNPVEFITDIQPSKMINEYKNAKWLIYGACPKLKTVGYPLMVCEAQASGVGVLMYDLRDDFKLLLHDSGYLYKTEDEVLNIITGDFPEEKRNKGFELSKRYDINNNIQELLKYIL
jgi:hypothetical protein